MKHFVDDQQPPASTASMETHKLRLGQGGSRAEINLYGLIDKSCIDTLIAYLTLQREAYPGWIQSTPEGVILSFPKEPGAREIQIMQEYVEFLQRAMFGDKQEEQPVDAESR